MAIDLFLPLAAAAEALPFLSQITLLIIAAASLGYLCQRLRIVPIVGFLLAGVVIGPFGPLSRLFPGADVAVTDVALVTALADYGVILLLFTLGLEFSLSRLAAIKGLIFGAGCLQVAGTLLIVTILLLPLADWRSAVFTGCLVALSSTAIVVKLLGDNAQTASETGQASLAILIFQDLAVVAMVMLVPLLAPAAADGTGNAEGNAALALAWVLAKAGLIILAVLLLARRVVPVLLEFVARTCRGEIFLLSVLSVCVTTAWATGAAGASAALGAFLGGLVVSESKFHHYAYGEIMPLQVLFSAMFFVSVGMLLDPLFVLANLPLVLGIVLSAIVLKTLVTAGSLVALGRSWPLALGVGLTLAQVGEFAFVLARVGAAAGLAPLGMAAERGFQTFVGASVVLMLVTPSLQWAGARVARRTAAAAQGGVAESSAMDLSGHVVIDGWGPVGRLLAAALKTENVPHVVVTLNPAGALEAEGLGHRVVRGATSRRASLEQAGAARAATVIIADDDPDTTRRAAAVARDIALAAKSPMQVLALVSGSDAIEGMRDAGAAVVLDSNHSSAARLLREALLAVGRDAVDAERAEDELLRRVGTSQLSA